MLNEWPRGGGGGERFPNGPKINSFQVDANRSDESKRPIEADTVMCVKL